VKIEGEGNLRAVVNVRLDLNGLADIENKEAISRTLEKNIADEIKATAAQLQKEYRLDGYNWLEVLRKYQNALYRKYADQWCDMFENIEVVANVRVQG